MSRVLSAALIGLDAVPITVESDIANGLSSFSIVGLPDTAVQESRERVRAAIKNSGFSFPRTRVTINLAPADVKKEGPSYDLPIAISLLIEDGLLTANELFFRDALFLGELALNGDVRPITGALSAALLARQDKISKIFVPKENAAEAALIHGLEIYPIDNLFTLVSFLNNQISIEKFERRESDVAGAEQIIYDIDFVHINGQDHAKRALEVGAAGGHNILLSGPPGAGKTLLARSLPSILPTLTQDEAIEVTRIWSVAGLLNKNTPLVFKRPFRSPHHSASAVSLVGGGSWPKPGEVSLAHHGVLFLDEFPEFSRQVLENLRQPLEDGFVTVSRASGSVEFPAKFMLVAAQNPCPCGFMTDPLHRCLCSPTQILNYQKRISGPLLDRIDIHLEVPPVPVEELLSANNNSNANSKQLREAVQTARDRQVWRGKDFGITSNSQLKNEHIKKLCHPEDAAIDLLKVAIHKLRLSARAYYRILKLSRTIADLDNKDQIETSHLAEALQYRPKRDEVFATV